MRNKAIYLALGLLTRLGWAMKICGPTRGPLILKEADQGAKSNGAMAGARLAIRLLIDDVSVCDAADLAGHELTGLAIGASRRRTTASEISSPPADVEQRQDCARPPKSGRQRIGLRDPGSHLSRYAFQVCAPT